MIELEMPYLANLSVNRCHFMFHGRPQMRSDVRHWMSALQWEIEVAGALGYARGDRLRVGIEVIAPAGPGRLPDTENFRKPIHDAVAAALWRDDQRFVPWEEQSPPARRGEGQGAIIVRVEVVT